MNPFQELCLARRLAPKGTLRKGIHLLHLLHEYREIKRKKQMTGKELVARYAEKGIILCKVWHDGKEWLHFYDDEHIVTGKVAQTLIDNKENLLPIVPRVGLLNASDIAELSELARAIEIDQDEYDYDQRVQKVYAACLGDNLPPLSHPVLLPHGGRLTSSVETRGEFSEEARKWLLATVARARSFRDVYGDGYAATPSYNALCEQIDAVVDAYTCALVSGTDEKA